MKKKYLLYAAMPVLAVTLFAAQGALAYGWFGGGFSDSPEKVAERQGTLFQEQADILGVGIDEVKNAWAQGKTLWDLAKEKGISPEDLQKKLADVRNGRMKEHLQVLVDAGVITQSQADQRYTWMTESANGRFGGRHGMRGLHHGMGGWF